ncbi:MAG: carbamoyl phosphate synthase large subunit, partial [Bdellovibrionales bacterium]|nr:carbamoyl phosphate synthase large subunit [Bdellovibrionales bacterium]
ESESKKKGVEDLDLLRAKRLGFSDQSIANWYSMSTEKVRTVRESQKVLPAYFQVDTCAGEFAAETPYFYSTYWGQREAFSTKKESIVLLGSGPNRIGQGIEFDYSCVRSVRQFQREGFHVAMVNSNPETVSTDYDTSDILFFEPITEEHTLEVLRYLQPKGFVAQLGGQTPINLAPALVKEGFNLLGSTLES